MAREFPIHNGRMTTDLDANGHRIKNLPPGSGFTQVQSDWGQTDTTAPDYIKNKPTIPAPVSVDATLTQQGAAADAKVVGDALRGGFTPWVFSGIPEDVHNLELSWYGTAWSYSYAIGTQEYDTVLPPRQPPYDGTETSLTLVVASASVTATRHLVTPTKTSQLTNDGAPNGGGTPYATTAQVAAKQDVLTAAQLANIADVPNKADAADVNAALAQKANATDLPYALVTPGEDWRYSGLIDGLVITDSPSYDSVDGTYTIYADWEGAAVEGYSVSGLQEDEPTVSFGLDLGEEVGGSSIVTITATRTPPGHLLDRAVNAVSVSAATTLTLPALVSAGKMRDLYIRLTVSATSEVTWTVAQGESWDAMGAPPSSFAEGTYLYHISEVAPGVWHAEDMFAVVRRIPMYPMVPVTPSNGTLTVAPYTVATYTAGSSAAAFTVAVGAGTAGKARDCELVIDCTETGAVAPTVTWDTHFHPRTDTATDLAIVEAVKRAVFYISEYAPGEFAVGGWVETEGGSGT